jgi:hypothetical protein
MKIVAFVEGQREGEGADDPLQVLWARDIPKLVGVASFSRVVPISKHHLVAMDVLNLGLTVKTSTLTVGLDQLIAAELKLRPFDSALVAWDLVPPWDKAAGACRWNDTLSIYRGLAASSVLPAPWKAKAAARLAELEGRPTPDERARLPQFEAGSVLGVCAVPLFEDVFMDERAVRGALGLRGSRVQGWPSNWRGAQDPKDVLAQAIGAAQRMRPKPEPVRKMFVGLHEAPHEWASFLLKHPDVRAHALEHPVFKRLVEVCPRSSS